MKNVKEITITLEHEEWEKVLKKAFNKIKKDVKIDGFRKGAVTWDLFVKKIGISSLFKDAVDIAANDNYDKALEESKVVPVVEPEIDIKELTEDKLVIVYKFISKPSVKVKEYKNLGIKKEKAKVTKEEIDAEIENLRNRFAEIVEKEKGKLEIGETAIIDFKGVVDGKELEGGSGSDYPLEIGSNTFIPGFEDGLVGMKIKETKVLNLKFPENYVDNLKNKDVEFTVTLKGIRKRVLPEINEDFYKDLGYDDVKTKEDLDKKVKEHLLEHKNKELENKYIDEILKKATETMEVEINPEIIHSEVHRMIHQYEEQLRMQGLTLAQYFEFTKSSMEDFEKQLEPEATNRIKERYLLESVAELEKIDATKEEVEEDIKKISEMYNMSEDDVLENIGGIDMIKYDVKMRKALEFLKNN